MHKTKRAAISTLVLAAGSVCAQDTAPAPGLDWLEGQWCGGDATMHLEETWLPGRGDMHFGVSRTTKEGRVVSFEFLRIALVDGKPTYLAQPGGKAATAFTRSAGGEHWVRFENPDHDFPKRIEYRRTGKALSAEIAGPGRDGKEKVIGFQFELCED